VAFASVGTFIGTSKSVSNDLRGRPVVMGIRELLFFASYLCIMFNLLYLKCSPSSRMCGLAGLSPEI